MELVGLTGYKRSGKDTFAKVMIEEGGFVRMAFADALKREVADWCGISVAQLEHEKEQLRRVLQLRGTFRRAQSADYWIEKLHDLLLRDCLCDRVVITDVRYPDEASMVRDLGGTILRMRRLDQPTVTDDTHASETSVDLIVADEEIACNSILQRQMAARAFLSRMGG